MAFHLQIGGEVMTTPRPTALPVSAQAIKAAEESLPTGECDTCDGPIGKDGFFTDVSYMKSIARLKEETAALRTAAEEYMNAVNNVRYFHSETQVGWICSSCGLPVGGGHSEECSIVKAEVSLRTALGAQGTK